MVVGLKTERSPDRFGPDQLKRFGFVDSKLSNCFGFVSSKLSKRFGFVDNKLSNCFEGVFAFGAPNKTVSHACLTHDKRANY